MKKYTKLSLNFVFSLGLLLAGATEADSASLVTNLSLEKKGDLTYFTIFAEDRIEFTHFILPATDDKSHRIVVDLEDAIHKLPKNNFIDLPPGTVNAIRTSQYQVDPKKITRIVLDLKEPVIYQVEEQKKENQITFALSTKKDPSSIFWAADAKAVKTKKKVEVKREDKKKLAKQKPLSSPKETGTVTAPTEIRKETEKKMVKKGIEVELTPPQAEERVEIPKREKSKGPATAQPEVVPVATMDTSGVQPISFWESEDEKKGVAERESLIYVGEEKRDPFVPLSQEIDFEFGEIPLPTVENLKLVGTLEDYGGHKALLEDNRGYGYLLKSGDKVKNGFVVNVFKNKIFFQIEEYGWSRVISLELPHEY